MIKSSQIKIKLLLKNTFNIVLLIAFSSFSTLPASQCQTGDCKKHSGSHSQKSPKANESKANESKASESNLAKNTKTQKSLNCHKHKNIEDKKSTTCNSMGSCYLAGELKKEPEMALTTEPGLNKVAYEFLYVTNSQYGFFYVQNSEVGKIEIRAGPNIKPFSLYKLKSSFII